MSAPAPEQAAGPPTPDSLFSLAGRTALVTGASGGIGGAIARTLHAAGATLVLSGTRAAALQELAESLGDRAHVAPADLGTAEGPEALVKAAEAATGGLDILVHNAGLTRDGLLLRMKDEDWARVLDVNLTAAFRLSRAALRGMMKRRFGRIVVIGSVMGSTGNAGQANYAASKAGLIGFAKSLAAEVGSRGVTVNCVAPGFIETAMTEGLSAELRDKALAQIPLGRIGRPEDVAAAVLYLSAAAGGYVTGATLHVNGGMAMV